MGLQTSFQSGQVLYAVNLNSNFANTVSVAGDTVNGALTLVAPGNALIVSNSISIGVNASVGTALTINNIDIGSGLKSVYNLANSIAGNASVSSTFNANNGITVNGGSQLITSGNNIINISANTASTTQAGVVQLNDTLTSTSTTLAPTANMVNYAAATSVTFNVYSQVANSIFDYNVDANNATGQKLIVTRSSLSAANVTILNGPPTNTRGYIFDFFHYNSGWKSQWAYAGGNAQTLYMRGTNGGTGDWGQWFGLVQFNANNDVSIANNLIAAGNVVAAKSLTTATLTANGAATLFGGANLVNQSLTVQKAPIFQTSIPIYMIDQNHLNNYNVAAFASTTGITYAAITQNYNNNNINDQGEWTWDWYPTSNATTSGSVLVKNGSGNPNAVGRWIARLAGKTISPEMFGAIGDGQTDDYIAFQAMINILENVGSLNIAFPSVFSGATIRLTPNKTYYIGGGPNMTSASLWSPNTAYANGTIVTNPVKYYYSPAQANGAPFANGSSLLFNNIGNLYTCINGGTSANANSVLQTGPTGLASNIIDGTCTWKFLSGNNLTLTNKTIIVGDMIHDNFPHLLNANLSAYTANCGGFLLNPNVTITLQGSSRLEKTIILPTTLQYNPMPNADGVIAAVQGWGNVNSIGVWMQNSAQLEKCLIVGFNTGVLCNSGSKSIKDLKIDCYNGMEFYRIGDTGLCMNVMLEQAYLPQSGQNDPGSGTVPNQYRPGIGFNIHDRCDGYEFYKLFSFNYQVGMKVSNVWALRVHNFSVDNGSLATNPYKNANGDPTIAIWTANNVTYAGFNDCNFVGPMTWYLYNTACDVFDTSQPNPLIINVAASQNSSPGMFTLGLASVAVRGGNWGPNIYLGPGTKTTFDDVIYNMSSYTYGAQIDDNIKYAVFRNSTLLQGGGQPWLSANNSLVTSGRLTIDNVHHVDQEYASRLTRLTTQPATHQADPTIQDGVVDPWQPTSVQSFNSQKRQDSSFPNRTVGIMRNWTEVGYIDATSTGMVLDTNNSILSVTGVTIANGGLGYKIGNIVQLTGGTPATPGQNAAIVVNSVAANGAITGATIVQGGSYVSLPTIANTLGIISSINIASGGISYTNNKTKIMITGDGAGASYSVFSMNANGTILNVANTPFKGYGILSSGFGWGYSTANVVIYPTANVGNPTVGTGAVLTANIGSGAQFNVVTANPNILTLNPSGNTVVANTFVAQAGMMYKSRVITTNGTTTILLSDYIVVANSPTGGTFTFNLPAGPTQGTTFKFKDGKGDAGANNITISGNGLLIDGQPNAVIDTNRRALEIHYDGIQWEII